MKRKMKTCCVLLSMFVLMWVSSQVSAAKTCEDVQIRVTLQEARRMAQETALEWAAALEPSANITVSDVQDVETGDGSWEFMVSYSKGTESYGYSLVIVNDTGAVVKESTLAPGKENPLEEIKEDVEENEDIFGEQGRHKKERLAAVGDLDYMLAYEDENGDTVYVDESGETYRGEDLYGAKKYANGDSIYIEKSNWYYTKYKVNEKTKLILPKYDAKKKLVSQKKVTDAIGYYACSIQSLMQIAYMEGLLPKYTDKNIKAFYDDMRGRNVIMQNKKGDKGITYGDTLLTKAANGFVKYAVDAGYKGTKLKTVQKNPDINWIRNKLEYNRPVLFGYGLNVNGKRVGHMISVLGAMKAKKVSSGNTWNYLMVYNAWDDRVSYINFDCVDFMDSIATYFWVKKK